MSSAATKVAAHQRGRKERQATKAKAEKYVADEKAATRLQAVTRGRKARVRVAAARP